MSKYDYSKTEQEFNNVLNYQRKELEDIKRKRENLNDVGSDIFESERLLTSLGYQLPVGKTADKNAVMGNKKIMIVPAWEELCRRAENEVGSACDLETLFTKDELVSNGLAVKMLNEEYQQLHRLDALDYTICAIAGIVAGAVDILMVGIPKAGPDGVKAGPLSDYIRKKFDEKFPPEKMEALANSKISKVPYDAQDNRHTKEHVEGLSAYYHRLLSLGHDPLLGFIVGVFDILTGRMTTIDKRGRIVSQVMENYADRKESNIFAAIAKQCLHLKSDITTSMGLPVPLMGLFNLLQFGSIGEAEQTIAEIVQGMYYEGYDFIHFCSMTIPTMLVEVMVRMCYAFKRIKKGYSIKKSIPFSLDRQKHPKLATMLFVAHAGATAINAGKVYFTGNPMAINYPQWMAFAKYSYKQLKWAVLEKPAAREAYVRGKINEELTGIYDEIDSLFEDFSKKYIVVFSGV